MSGTDDELCDMSAAGAASRIRRKTLSPVELVRAILRRIERVNPALNAYCTVAAESAIAAAEEAERAVIRGEPLGPLHGVPVSIKDLIPTKGIRTTFGSKLYENLIPQEDAPVVERLKAAGAIILGKTNTPEFGHKAVTDNVLFGASRNPWDLDYTPGGSSGGAAAAVIAGLGPVAVGTDSGGSIRIPSSCCGTFGFKPTLGRVAQAPAFGGLETTNHIGPITRTVRDAALVLDAIVGPDPRDIGSLPNDGGRYLNAVEVPVTGLRIAWSADLGYAPVDREVREVTTHAIRAFDAMHHHLEEAHPGFASPEKAFLTVASVNAAARFAEVENLGDLDPSFARWVEAGKRYRAVEFVKAANERRVVGDALSRLFARFDLLVTPTLAAPPLRIGLDTYERIDGQEVTFLGWQAFTFPLSFAGCPAATVPCGFTKTGLPIGLQIAGPRLSDHLVVRVAAMFESLVPFPTRPRAI